MNEVTVSLSLIILAAIGVLLECFEVIGILKLILCLNDCSITSGLFHILRMTTALLRSFDINVERISSAEEIKRSSHGCFRQNADSLEAGYSYDAGDVHMYEKPSIVLVYNAPNLYVDKSSPCSKYILTRLVEAFV